MRLKISRERRSRLCSAEAGWRDALDGRLVLHDGRPCRSGGDRMAGRSRQSVQRHQVSVLQPRFKRGFTVPARRRLQAGMDQTDASRRRGPRNAPPPTCAPVSLERGVAKHAEGSCLVRFGDTHVLCTASLDEKVPPWLRGGGKGWVTAEYGMLPRATTERTRREASAGKQSGRTLEIQRLIGRSLRAVVDLAGARRAPDHDRLRRHPGRRRHAHRLDHRRLGGAPRLHRMDARPRHDRRSRCSPITSPRSRPASIAARRSSTSTMPRTSRPHTDANFVMTGVGRLRRDPGDRRGRAVHRGGVRGAAGARPRRHRAARRAAEARDPLTADRDAARFKRGETLVVATHNPGKLREIEELVAPLGLERDCRPARSACPSRRRPATTFEANAALKAVAAATASGLPALADDSGVCRSTRSAASPASIRRAGPGPDKDFARRHADGRGASSTGARRDDAGEAHARVSSRSSASPSPTAARETFRGEVEGTLVWPPRGDERLRLRPDVRAGRLRPRPSAR